MWSQAYSGSDRRRAVPAIGIHVASPLVVSACGAAGNSWHNIGSYMKQVLTKSSVLILSSMIGCAGKTADSQTAGAQGGAVTSGTASLGGTTIASVTSHQGGTAGAANTQQGGNAGSIASPTGGYSSGGTSGGTAGSGTSVTGGAAGQSSSAQMMSGGTAGSGTSVTGGAAGQSSIAEPCGSSNCCVALSLTAANISVNQFLGLNYVSLLVERTQAQGTELSWSATAKVTTSWGGTQDCPLTAGSTIANNYAINCPGLTPVVSTPCGSNTEVSITLRSNTFSDYNGSSPICLGDDSGMTLTYVVPVNCPLPNCPPTDSITYGQECFIPTETTCSYLTTVYGGGTALLPCNCRQSQYSGTYTWSCAVS
jgi:hypothetical protein